jgi:TRAP-type transport system periplasmic protein
LIVLAGRRIILGSALAAPFVRTARADPIKLRVSLDTAPGHGRTLSIADFLKKLEAASQGQIAPQLFDSGQLCPDQEVIKALVLGKVEMAVPGTWLVAAYVPEADLGQLPIFYGQPEEITHRAIDGIPGDMVNEQVSKKLRVTIPGRWIDLGFVNWYSARKPLNTLRDLKGLKIRNSGGFAQPWRAQFFGGIPNVTPWPDVPLELSQGTFEALQTSSESCASAKLWDSGLRYGLIDHQNMGDYIPMFSESFWATLSPSLKSHRSLGRQYRHLSNQHGCRTGQSRERAQGSGCQNRGRATGGTGRTAQTNAGRAGTCRAGNENFTRHPGAHQRIGRRRELTAVVPSATTVCRPV